MSSSSTRMLPSASEPDRTNFKSRERKRGLQFKALFVKSWHIQKRSHCANCCAILTPIILMLILVAVQILVDTFLPSTGVDLRPALQKPSLFVPRNLINNRIPYDSRIPFVASDNIAATLGTFNSLNTSAILSSGIFSNLDWRSIEIRPARSARFPRVPVPAVNFTRFSSVASVNAQLFDSFGSNRPILSAYAFTNVDSTTKSLEYSVFYNSSVGYTLRPGQFVENQNGSNAIASTYLIDKAVYESFSPGNTFTFSVKPFPSESEKIKFDIVGFVEDFYFTLILHVLFPIFMSTLVQEKEAKLRYLMNMMGLDSRIYWVVTFLWDYLFYLVSLFVFLLVGGLSQFRFFTMNDPGTYILLFICWGFVLVSFSFFVSTLFQRQQTSFIVGYLILLPLVTIATIINQTLSGVGRDPSPAVIFFTSLIPTFSISRGVIYLSQASRDDGIGIRLSQISSSGLGSVYGYLIGVAILYLLLTYYMEQVLPGNVGVAEHPCFCCFSQYWKRLCGKEVLPSNRDDESQSALSNPSSSQSEGIFIGGDEEYERFPDGQDIIDERKKALQYSPRAGEGGVCIKGLRKMYPGAERAAVQEFSLRIPEGECFGLLGHNGAGKTTLLSVLTGLIGPTSGDALVDDHSILTDMEHIYTVTGVCPQFDITWPDLTGSEHLYFFSRIKGMSGNDLDEEVRKNLAAVNLLDAADKKSREYSGGMRRRLATAISLCGNPKIVFLDEPSTGLDPSSRQLLWAAIKEAKKGKCIILTTHSMTEADYLCDRLAIAAHGRMRCIGYGEDLKRRFGTGFRVMTSCPTNREMDVRGFVQRILPQARLMKHIANTSTYEVPEPVSLAEVFASFEQNKEILQIYDWSISHASLEDVFLRVGHINLKEVE